MACDFQIPEGWTAPQRKAQIDEALDRLKKALAAGTVTVKVGPRGELGFVGAWDRGGVADSCAYRKLLAAGSPELRRAVAKAEGMAGRKVDAQMVASGAHLHGDTWHKGH